MYKCPIALYIYHLFVLQWWSSWTRSFNCMWATARPCGTFATNFCYLLSQSRQLECTYLKGKDVSKGGDFRAFCNCEGGLLYYKNENLFIGSIKLSQTSYTRRLCALHLQKGQKMTEYFSSMFSVITLVRAIDGKPHQTHITVFLSKSDDNIINIHL